MLSNLKNIRNYKGLTLKQLSYKTGISKSYLFKLENLIKINPNYKIVKSLTKALNIMLDELEMMKCKIRLTKIDFNRFYIFKYESILEDYLKLNML